MPSWVPTILHPTKCFWPRPIQYHLLTKDPGTPSVSRPWVRRFWGWVHRALVKFSRWYCPIFGVRYDWGPINTGPIFPLPFGLLIKWSDRTSIAEAVATQMARSGGLPAPKVLCYGEHPGQSFEVSILMTRLPGYGLFNYTDVFDVEEEQPWFDEFVQCMDAVRRWPSPFPDGMVCSATGGEIKTIRAPGRKMGPFSTTNKMMEYLLEPASCDGLTEERFHEHMTRARQLCDRKHRITFTHGDVLPWNLLVDDDFKLSGIIDWESAGWQPEYWEYVTSMRRGKDTWWYQAMNIMCNNEFDVEREADNSMAGLTADAWGI